MERVLKPWTGLASNFIGECFDCAKPFIDDGHAGLEPFVRFVSAQLFIDCHLSSESVLLLIAAQKEWDADLISRSVMEGSIKFAYMLNGDANEAKKKAVEYWDILPQFFAIKRSERAKRLVQDIKNPDDPVWKPFHDLIVEDKVVEQIRNLYSRKQRSVLEEKWSFSGICREFAQTEDEGLKGLVHLAHGYGMSSHLLHKDADGVAMVWERYGRDETRQAAVKLGHSARVVSDICSFAQLRLFCLLRSCRESTQLVREIEDRYRGPLFSELAKAARQFTRIEYGEPN